MLSCRLWVAFVASFALVALCSAQDGASKEDKRDEQKGDSDTAIAIDAKTSDSEGSVSVGGKLIAYKAVAGTILLTNKDDDKKNPTASIFYAAYFKKGEAGENRPVTFFYNGGPGSSTIWLHMGAFGPRRVMTLDDQHTPAAPYRLVANEFSLLDVSDLVFIDAPGTGFSRLVFADKNKEKEEEKRKDRIKEFYGVDGDAHAFAQFITRFLSQYGRWNSPKYLFGESYGTTRSGALANILETEDNIDLNGVILLSQVLSYANDADGPQFNPGVDIPYALALPTFAATAWYHHKVPNQTAELKPFLAEVESFAMGEYIQSLLAGATLAPEKMHAIAEKVHNYTGLPTAYVERANLRINAGMFERTLQADTDLTTGRLDTRFSGPQVDALEKEAAYDPQSAAISSAYVSAFNDYVRKQLKFGEGETYKPEIDTGAWNFQHQPPGSGSPLPIATNVMLDLALALKYNPNLRVMVNGGYFDLATPYFGAIYEMRHLPIPRDMQSHIEYAFYPSGHMVYAHEESLKQIHANVAAFISKTDNIPGNAH